MIGSPAFSWSSSVIDIENFLSTVVHANILHL